MEVVRKYEYQISRNLTYVHTITEFIPVLGRMATALYCHLRGWLLNNPNNDRNLLILEDGSQWHEESVGLVAFCLKATERSIFTAKNMLQSLGLIECTQVDNYDSCLLWRLGSEEIRMQFEDFCNALTLVAYPIKSKKLEAYEFYVKNPDIIAKFKDYVKDFDKYFSDNELMAQARQNCANSPSQPAKSTPAKSPRKSALNAKEHLPEKPKTPETPPKPDRFVEHWNAQPNVPKCRIGTKGYEQARAFFKAHQRYQAGNCSGFMLDKVEQERISLRKTNRIPPDTERRGPKKTPMRSDAQMFEHIERAAKVYQPEYWPADKAKLPKRLVAFLYNAYSKAHGQCSMFLEKLQCPPQLLEEANGDALWDAASSEERKAYHALRVLYNYANYREPEDDLPVREQKSALNIAKRIYRHYRDHYWEFVDNMFPNFTDFIHDFRDMAYDFVWDGMPISALDVGKKIWVEVLACL